MRFLTAALCAVLAAAPAVARPVSYPGGVTLMQELDPMMGSALLHYTPDRHYSVGGRYLRLREAEANLAGGQVTWLARRWNMPSAQANVYVTGMAGGAWRDGETARPGGFVEAQADWENRRVMLMGMARLTHADNLGTSDMQMARIGWAPYAGDYGDAHLWLFAQVMRDSAMQDEVQPAIVGRILYRTILVEAGVTDRGGLILNSVFRF
ncbi:hypothetical protein [Sandaracinobacteroides hominis]|uniref:hypothetical protein n=1 Tax=Sandaracinobacteroides hominis TaxID=2780086 RepID=UPI0018F3D8DD|nr:hypothetical protein [Sandaracinobacteroides hominis]